MIRNNGGHPCPILILAVVFHRELVALPRFPIHTVGRLPLLLVVGLRWVVRVVVGQGQGRGEGLVRASWGVVVRGKNLSARYNNARRP